MSTVLIVLPVITAITAWLTARVIIYMVLYPLAPKRIAGVTLQGFLIKNQADIAAKIGEGIAAELANAGGSLQLVSPDTIGELQPLIDQHLDSFLKVKLKEKMPVIASFIGDSTMVKLKAGMMEEIELLLPEIIAKYTSSLTTDPAIKAKIIEKIATYPPAAIEKHIGPGLRHAMVRIPLIFGFFGLIAGMVMSLFCAAFPM